MEEREEKTKTDREWERSRGKAKEGIKDVGNENRTLPTLSNSLQIAAQSDFLIHECTNI